VCCLSSPCLAVLPRAVIMTMTIIVAKVETSLVVDTYLVHKMDHSIVWEKIIPAQIGRIVPTTYIVMNVINIINFYIIDKADELKRRKAKYEKQNNCNHKYSHYYASNTFCKLFLCGNFKKV